MRRMIFPILDEALAPREFVHTVLEVKCFLPDHSRQQQQLDEKEMWVRNTKLEHSSLLSV